MNPQFGALFEPTASLQGCDPSVAVSDDLYGNTTPAANCVPGAGSKSLRPVKPKHILPPLPLLADGKPYSPKGWTLLALLSPEGQTDVDASRSQLVVLKSMLQQFSSLGLNVDVAPTVSLSPEATANWPNDWDFGHIQLLANTNPASVLKRLGIDQSTGMVLVSPDKNVVRTWNGLTSPAEVELALRLLLGTPPGMQEIKVKMQHH